MTVPARLIVWDVDGTLIDSRASIFRAAVEAADEIGVSRPSYDQVRAIVGLSLFEALQHMRPDLESIKISAYVQAYKDAFVRFHQEPGFFDPLYSGAQSCLLGLKAMGWKLGMATGQSRRGVERNLEVHGWTDLFDCTFCADDGPSKPHPHMLQSNIKAMGATKASTVMVGDTAHDINMARHAGVVGIGVSWGFHTAEELSLAGADRIVHDFVELNAALTTLSRTLPGGI